MLIFLKNALYIMCVCDAYYMHIYTLRIKTVHVYTIQKYLKSHKQKVKTETSNSV